MSASIPTSPPPGKDPPATSSSTDPDAKAASEKENKSPLAGRKSSTSANVDVDSKAMPPPPVPSTTSRPLITTQHPSSSNIPFSPSLTQSASKNTALQDHPHTSNSQSQEAGQEQDKDRERERPPFAPFFTLVNDLSGGEQSTHHPSQVHYLFADDDVSEVLTGALLRCMDQGADQDLADEEEDEQDDGEDATSSSSSATFRRDGTRIQSERSKAKQKKKDQVAKGRLKDRNTGREERVIIVDVNESGDVITGVSSLSPSWQVLNAEIGKAPTWDKDGAENEGGRGKLVGGLMLKIEGVGLDFGEPPSNSGGGGGIGLGAPSGGSKGKGKEKDREREGGGENQSGTASAVGDEEMQILLEAFDRRMGMLRRIVQRGSRENLADVERS
ncbi:hypothetical protein ONS96_014409 [Cadophora gregata f. sp. sojae]|nr:hypothetical protein ONS96_014409 [Cadophora gregata f. sp. sojae]